ncbi:hypothetical protein D3C76_328380 [compost metagenome]
MMNDNPPQLMGVDFSAAHQMSEPSITKRLISGAVIMNNSRPVGHAFQSNGYGLYNLRVMLLSDQPAQSMTTASTRLSLWSTLPSSVGRRSGVSGNKRTMAELIVRGGIAVWIINNFWSRKCCTGA